MKVSVEIDAETLQHLVIAYLSDKVNIPLKPSDVIIEVKSQQNYRAEWEHASFRARVAKVFP